MNAVEQRVKIFEGTMRACMEDESLQAAVKDSIENQYIIWQEDAPPHWEMRFERPAAVRVASIKRSFEAARAYAMAGKKVCVLNFASSVSPGGGVTYGSQAQEESLCRVSTLFPALNSETAKPFYDRHWELIRAGKMNRANRDDCIYTPGVVVVREDSGEEAMLPASERYTVDVITCAAPDLRRVDEPSRYEPGRGALLHLMMERWRRIMAAAAANGADVLILGAFGCGVFAVPPDIAAEAFEVAAGGIDRCFETIEFAVYSKDTDAPNYRAFATLAAGNDA